MCGIAGVIYRDGRTADPAVLRSMADTIAHRGPDADGLVVFAGGGFAHRRLSIIDLSPTGAQPMGAAGGQVQIVFNGEIYNFKELRAELENCGHSFKGHSDTEVILAAWLEWGEACVQRLDGMFAIALWDSRSRRLLLARDRTGKKPLYVYEDEEKLVFGSELKAIFAHPAVDRRPWPEAVPQFLSHGYVPTPHTFYACVRKVKPAALEVLEYGRRETREVQYWDFPLGPERNVSTDDDWLAVEHELRERFFAAVKRRMVADVPLGAFLSGGLDSSLVVAAMALQSSRPIKTFSIGFEGAPDYDETRFARMVAQRYGTDHTEFKVKPSAFDLIERLSWHLDEPFGDSSCIPTYLVSKLTREAGCTVALTGDGGDEVFAGYPRFVGAVAAETIPMPVRRFARRLTELTPIDRSSRSFLRRAQRLMHVGSSDMPDRLRLWLTYKSVDELLAELPTKSRGFVNEATIGERHRALSAKARGAGADALNEALYVNARTYLLDDLNVKVDRMSMAASLECRSPFLDTELMEWAFRLPRHVKLAGFRTKSLLKRTFADLIPTEIIHRKKMGFGIPLSMWGGTRAAVLPDRSAAEYGDWATQSLRRWQAANSNTQPE